MSPNTVPAGDIRKSHSPSTGHPIPAPPVPRTRKRKSPPQPRSGVISARQPVPAVEASRPSKAAPETAELAPAKPRAPRTTVAALAAKIQAQEARIQELETHMAETIIGYEARIDSLEIKLAGAQRTIGELTAAAEVASVMSRPVAGTIKELGLVQAKPEPKLDPKSTKEPAMPASAKSYANTLIWAAVILASMLIWAVASNRGGLEPKYVTAKLAASGMLMGQVEDGTWTFIGQIDRDSARVAAFARGYDLGESEGRYAGYDSATKRIHDSLARIPKPRKATMADFETDAERAHRLDSAARMGKRGPL